MKMITAAIGLAIGFASTQAEACTINQLTGWYDVTVVRTAYMFEEGDHVPPHSAVDLGTTHTLCQFEIGRVSRHEASINIHCNEDWTPEKPNGGQLPAPFVQDGFSQGGGNSFPWHQLHKVGRGGFNSRGTATSSQCMWDLIDLNSMDGPYTVSFSLDGMSLVGQGDGVDRPSDAVVPKLCARCRSFLTFHGVKVSR